MRANTASIMIDPPLAGAFPSGREEVISGLGARVQRSFDAKAVNAIVNHPDVRPFVGPGDAPLDLTAAVVRPENWFLLGAHGGFGLYWTAPGVHEVHTFVLPSGRGPWARQAAADGIQFARDHGDHLLWTRIAEWPNVVAFARGMGMKPVGMTIETFGLPYDVYSMRIG